MRTTLTLGWILLSCLLASPQTPLDPERIAKWEKEIAKLEERWKSNPPKEGGILFVGSSTIKGWDLAKSFPEWNVVNAGFGGSEVRDSVYFSPRIVTPHKPRVIVFYAGDNDIHSGRKPEEVAGDFKQFVNKVRESLAEVRILFISIKPSIARWMEYDKQARANELVARLCRDDNRLEFVNIVPLLLDGSGKPLPEMFVKDGLHLSDEGYRKVSDAIKTTLR